MTMDTIIAFALAMIDEYSTSSLVQRVLISTKIETWNAKRIQKDIHRKAQF